MSIIFCCSVNPWCQGLLSCFCHVDTALKFTFINSIFPATNFPPALLHMGAAAMCMHYDAMIQHFLIAPFRSLLANWVQPRQQICAAPYPSGGDYDATSASRELLLQKCAQGTIRFGLDDPSSKRDIRQLVINLFNGERCGNLTRGERNPVTTLPITANYHLVNSDTNK